MVSQALRLSTKKHAANSGVVFMARLMDMQTMESMRVA
jgi:hypothetical protein